MDKIMNELQKLCEQEGVRYEDVTDLLELYDSDEDEEVLLRRIAQYPENARQLVCILFLGAGLASV